MKTALVFAIWTPLVLLFPNLLFCHSIGLMHGLIEMLECRNGIITEEQCLSTEEVLYTLLTLCCSNDDVDDDDRGGGI